MSTLSFRDYKFFSSTISWFRIRVVEPLLLSENPPWFDARGAALGLLIGFGFPLGFQWISLGFIRLFFKFNAVLALGLTWVNNPLTVGPMYYAHYLIGSSLLGSSQHLNMDTFVQLMTPLFQAETFRESFEGLTKIGSEMLIRWTLGASLTGLAFGALGYIVTYLVQSKRQKKKKLAHQSTCNN